MCSDLRLFFFIVTDGVGRGKPSGVCVLTDRGESVEPASSAVSIAQSCEELTRNITRKKKRFFMLYLMGQKLKGYKKHFSSIGPFWLRIQDNPDKQAG